MPLTIEGDRVPPRWAERKRQVAAVGESLHTGADCVRIAFVNNMPDAALEDTEMQFLELIEAAAPYIPVRLSLHSLPGIPRGRWGQQHLDEYYFGMNDLFDHRYDGLIVTGTEPKQVDLCNEPYWSALSTVLDWAENNTVSTILSCLAAHASVLHSDGIGRYPLSEKQCGVFTFKRTASCSLMGGSTKSIRVPHSRWNEVRPEELAACDYTILTQSTEAGVDAFIKKKKRSLFVHFQGHPEYDRHTLLKEYRRDIKRFVRGERDTYPSIPAGYFDMATATLAAKFREVVLFDRREELLDKFPETIIAPMLQKTWQSSALSTYHNWLNYVILNKANVSGFSPVTMVPDLVEPSRSALQ
jgi:homoserine O-succinyltransferase/O-acetyltransferase